MRNPNVRESTLERRFVRGCELRGLEPLKLYRLGYPDRIVTGQGRALFVEVKREAGRLSKVQEAVIQKLQDEGYTVIVLRPSNFAATMAMIDEFFNLNL